MLFTYRIMKAGLFPTYGLIAFPAAFMQPPVLYSPDLPSYLTYGVFGYAVGHEIAHGMIEFRVFAKNHLQTKF